MTKYRMLPALQDPNHLPGSLGVIPGQEPDPHFVVVGHRGAMALAPENSAASFRLAEAAGADEVELDIRVTADGVPVVVHDPTLERLAAGGPHLAVPVNQLTLAQLQEVPLASGQAVPHLF